MSTAVELGLVPLSFLLTQNRDEEPPVEPVVPFEAVRTDPADAGAWQPITVTALLERTAAFYIDGDRHDTGVLRLDLVRVDPAQVQWRVKVGDNRTTGDPRHWRRTRTSPADGSGAAARRQSDERALADQARKAQEAELERQRIAAAREDAARVALSTEPAAAGAFTAEQAEGESTMSAKTKVCKGCGKEKPASKFDRRGWTALYCHDGCKDAEMALRRALKGGQTAAIPAESKPPQRLIEMPKLTAEAATAPNGHDGSGDTLLDQIRRLIADRDSLRAQLDAIEAALVHA